MQPAVIEHVGEVAVIRMLGAKANAMSATMLDSLIAAVDRVEASDAHAVVLIGQGRAFSAGLALPELIELERGEMGAFIDRFSLALRRVLCCSLPTVAAVNGHAVAGGCALALQCDARLMAEGAGRIGLNEVRLGIGLPAGVIEPLRLRLPPTSLTQVALEGRLVGAAEALRLGLIDDVVAADELIARAITRAAELGEAPRAAYAQVKAALLRPVLETIDRNAAVDRARWLDTWFGLPARALLREAVARLTGN